MLGGKGWANLDVLAEFRFHVRSALSRAKQYGVEVVAMENASKHADRPSQV